MQPYREGQCWLQVLRAFLPVWLGNSPLLCSSLLCFAWWFFKSCCLLSCSVSCRKQTDNEYRSQHLVHQLRKSGIIPAIICLRSGCTEFTRGQVKGYGLETYRTTWKSKDMFTFLLYTFERETQRLVCHKSKDCHCARRHYVLCLATFTKRMAPQSPSTCSSTHYYRFN